MTLHNWGAVFLMNVSITAALGFADFAHEGAGIARMLFYLFAIVCGGLLLTRFFTLMQRGRASLDEDDEST